MKPQNYEMDSIIIISKGKTCKFSITLLSQSISSLIKKKNQLDNLTEYFIFANGKIPLSITTEENVSAIKKN